MAWNLITDSVSEVLCKAWGRDGVLLVIVERSILLCLQMLYLGGDVWGAHNRRCIEATEVDERKRAEMAAI